MGKSPRRRILTPARAARRRGTRAGRLRRKRRSERRDSVKGKTVQISGGITGTEADALNKTFDDFTKKTGIKVDYTGDKSFEGNIVTKVNGGSAPDIAIVPQPGLLQALVGTG